MQKPGVRLWKKYKRVVVAFLLGFVLVGGAPRSVMAEESLFLSVKLNKVLITDIIMGTQTEEGVFINTKEIASLLESETGDIKKEVVSIEQLNEIYPAKFNFSPRNQTLVITGWGKLSIERRWSREYRQKYLTGAVHSESEDVPVNYRLVGLPTVDVSSTYQSYDNENLLTYSVAAVSEGLYGETRVQALGDNEALDAFRVSWGRIGPKRSYKVGDVFTRPLELVANSQVGRGVLFSTFPLNRGSNFNTETIEGDLQVGWEVELYRRGILLGFQKDEGTGRFVFDDVPLAIGDNDLTLKFYGPQGQVRETSDKVRIGSEMVPKGKLWSNFGMIEQGETLLIGRDKTAREDAEGARITGEVYYGLTNQLTFATSGAYLDVPGEGKKLITKLGLRGSYFSASERFDVLSDHSGGHGLHFGLQRKFFNTDVQVSHVEFFDMATEREQDLSRLFTLRMDKYFGNFSLGFKAERETSADGINYHEIGVRASGSIAGINLTHRVEANLNEGQDTVRANLLASGRATSDLHLRGGIEYAVQPIVELEKFTASLDYQQNEKIRYRIAGSKSVKYDRELFLSSGIFWDTGKASLGLTGSYSSEHDLQVIASITFSLSPDSSGRIKYLLISFGAAIGCFLAIL